MLVLQNGIKSKQIVLVYCRKEKFSLSHFLQKLPMLVFIVVRALVKRIKNTYW